MLLLLLREVRERRILLVRRQVRWGSRRGHGQSAGGSPCIGRRGELRRAAAAAEAAHQWMVRVLQPGIHMVSTAAAR